MNTITLATTAATLTLIGLLGLLFTKRLSWGMALFIFALPFERIGAFSLNPSTGYPLLHPAQIVGAALIGAYILRRFIERKPGVRLKPFVYLGVFLLTSAISAVIVNVQEVWQILAWLVFITSLFYVVAQVARTQKIALIRKAIAVTAIVVCSFGIYQFIGNVAGLSNDLTGIRERYGKVVLGFPRLQSTALEPLYFANYLFVPLFVLLALAIRERPNKLTVIALALTMVAFGLTFSRGAFVSGLIGLIVFLIATGRQFWGWFRQYAKFILPLLLVILLAGGATIAYSIKTRTSVYSLHTLGKFFSDSIVGSGSFTERARDQRLAIDIFQEHPIFGVGIGGFGSAYYDCKAGKCVYRPNNQALEVLAEGGIVGFITFHLFLIMLLVYGWKAMRKATGEHRAMIAGLMAATVAMVVQSQTFSGFLCCLTYTWATLGLLAGLSLPAEAKKVKSDALTSD